MRKALASFLTVLAIAGGPSGSRAETISLTFEPSSPLDYVVSYVSTGAGPSWVAVEFNANYGTTFSFNPSVAGVNLDPYFSVAFTSASAGHDWLVVRAIEGFVIPGLTAGPLTLGTLTVSSPLALHGFAPVGRDPTQDVHRLGADPFGDTYQYRVIPEPTTAFLLIASLAGLALLRRGRGL
jgi:hypothetical protein